MAEVDRFEPDKSRIGKPINPASDISEHPS
jgi:hypothetical protein